MGKDSLPLALSRAGERWDPARGWETRGDPEGAAEAVMGDRLESVAAVGGWGGGRGARNHEGRTDIEVAQLGRTTLAHCATHQLRLDHKHRGGDHQHGSGHSL